MSRISITPKTVNGDTATSLEVRIIMYRMDASPLNIYYAYYNASNRRIGEGNIQVTNSLSAGTKTALSADVTTSFPSALNIILAANQLYNNTYEFIYTQSGVPHLDVFVGSTIITTEYDAIKAAVLSALGVAEVAGNFLVMEDAVSYILMEDGTSQILLEV